MQRILFFLYGVLAHALFLAVYGCMALFVGGFEIFGLPTLDGPTRGTFGTSLTVDLLLIAAFAIPHSVMARPAFKSWWKRFVPPTIERSTYVFVSNLLMALLIWEWRPLSGVVWNVTHPVFAGALNGLFVVGWLAVPAASLMIDHFDLFGTRRVWLHLRGREYRPHPFRTPSAYRFVRHPLYVGWFAAFWATPTMTVSHFVFAGALTAYILIAIPFEERDLIAEFGGDYLDYKRTTGAFLPRLRRAEKTLASKVDVR